MRALIAILTTNSNLVRDPARALGVTVRIA